MTGRAVAGRLLQAFSNSWAFRVSFLAHLSISSFLFIFNPLPVKNVLFPANHTKAQYQHHEIRGGQTIFRCYIFGVILSAAKVVHVLSYAHRLRVLFFSSLYSSKWLAGAGRMLAIVRVHWVCSTRHGITGLNQIKPSIQPHSLSGKSHFSPHSFRVLVLPCLTVLYLLPFHLTFSLSDLGTPKKGKWKFFHHLLTLISIKTCIILFILMSKFTLTFKTFDLSFCDFNI